MNNKKRQSIIIFFVAIFFMFNFFYNQKREINAQKTGEESIACQNIVIDYSKCYFKTPCQDKEIDIENGWCCPEEAIDNLYEIPIGRTTDMAQRLAEQMQEKGKIILDQLITSNKIDIGQLCPLDACQAQCLHYPEQDSCIKNDENCSDLGDEENIWQEFPADECDPKCSGDKPKCCKLAERCLADKNEPCLGQACDDSLFAFIEAIINQTNIFQEKIDQMSKLEKDVKNIEENLAKSRLRLYLCNFVSADPEQALEKGYTGLMDCRTVMMSGVPIHSVLDNKLQFGCYGSQYCQAANKINPCLNDYFCCR